MVTLWVTIIAFTLRIGQSWLCKAQQLLGEGQSWLFPVSFLQEKIRKQEQLLQQRLPH